MAIEYLKESAVAIRSDGYATSYKAGKVHIKVAELYEEEGDPISAADSYSMAAEIFVTDGEKLIVNQCLVKAAELRTLKNPSDEVTRDAIKCLESGA